MNILLKQTLTVSELLAREKHYIKSVKCVNKNIPCQTQEEIKFKKKEYREANLEKIKENTICPCGGSYTYSDKSRHFKTIKHQEYLKSQKDV